MFAIAAIQGGAAGIRSEGVAKTAEIIKNVNVPVIGYLKTNLMTVLLELPAALKK
jgi:N-acylglucosamine-6-phosphate 2-epimerase